MNSNQQGSPGGPPAPLVAAIEKILRPLIKLLLSYQITYPQLIAMLKSIYVEVAEEEFTVPGKRQSDSRINLLTGVHRKDVKRLRAETRSVTSVPTTVSAGAQLIAYWLGNDEFTDDNGKPRKLAVKTEAGEEPGFDELVARVFKQDIRPRVILDEWQRLGVAHLDESSVVLNTGAFTPEKGFDEKVFFFGKNIQDHIAASSHNLLGQQPSYFDRSVYYDNLSQTSIKELSELANSLGMQALTTINKAALTKQQNDHNNPDNNHRMNFGVFNFNTEYAEEETPEDGN